MEQPKKQITARIPDAIYIGAMKKANETGLTFTDVLILALEKYLGTDLPGLCHVCNTQNDTNAVFCQMCGEPINSNEIESLRKQIQIQSIEIEKIKRIQEDMKKIAQALKDRGELSD